MILDLNCHTDRNIFLNREVDLSLTLFISKYLSDNSVFFDIGASSGYFSLVASTVIKKGQIHSFEPEPSSFFNLKRNVSLNFIKNVVTNNICIGSRIGRTKFYVSFYPDTSGIKPTSFQSNIKAINCKIETIDSYFKNKKIKKVDMMKIDVEGSEKDVLLGAQKTIEENRPVIIMEFSNITTRSYNYHPNDLYSVLEKMKYNIYSFESNRLTKQPKKDYYHENLFCFPREKMGKNYA